MAINLGRQRSGKKSTGLRRNLENLNYALESGLEKGVTSAQNLTTAATSRAQTVGQMAQTFISNPSSFVDFAQTAFTNPLMGTREYFEGRQSGNVDSSAVNQERKIYDTLVQEKMKTDLLKAKLIQGDAEYQQFVENRGIKFGSLERVGLAFVREGAAEVSNPYQLAVDIVGGKLGSFVGTKMMRYGKWAGIGSEIGVSAFSSGTANVLEGYAYGRRSPQELAIDFSIGSAFGLGMTVGMRGIGAAKNRALAKFSRTVDDAVDNALGRTIAETVENQVDNTTDFISKTEAGRKFNEGNVENFKNLQTQNEMANKITYGAVTDNILDGRFPTDSDISKVVTTDYQPNAGYATANGIVKENPEVITRLNQWLNETPQATKNLLDLPDSEIRALNPNISGEELRSLQNLKQQVNADFLDMDTKFQQAGLQNYNFYDYLSDERGYTFSEKSINIEQLANLKSGKETLKVQDVHSSNALFTDEMNVPDPDGYDFTKLNGDIPDDIANRRRGERINNTNQAVASQQAGIKAQNPEILTADGLDKVVKTLDTLDMESKGILKTFLDNCRL